MTALFCAVMGAAIGAVIGHTVYWHIRAYEKVEDDET